MPHPRAGCTLFRLVGRRRPLNTFLGSSSFDWYGRRSPGQAPRLPATATKQVIRDEAALTTVPKRIDELVAVTAHQVLHGVEPRALAIVVDDLDSELVDADARERVDRSPEQRTFVPVDIDLDPGGKRKFEHSDQVVQGIRRHELRLDG